MGTKNKMFRQKEEKFKATKGVIISYKRRTDKNGEENTTLKTKD